jgi:hypothetical protein
MLVTPIDLLFVAAGLAVTVLALRRRWAIPPSEPAPPATVAEVVLTGIALAATVVGPNILVVALTPGMPWGMQVLGAWVLVPAIAVLLAVWLVAFRLGQVRLTNRIWTGIWVGAASTAALDAIRLTGFSLGLMPGNLPRMFGVLLLDQMALGPTALSDFVGSTYHYWVGASFGLTYTLLVGRTRWWGVVIWALLIELGMMTTPPMVVAMGTGFFGLKWGYGILITSVPAHIACGVAAGLLLERYTRHNGSIVGIMAGAFAATPRERPVATRAH